MTAKKPQPRRAKKPAPGAGLLGWLGRQVGHVKNAVNADVTRPTPPAKAAARPNLRAASQPAAAPRTSGSAPKASASGPKAAPSANASESAPKVIYRNDKVEEAAVPDRPGVKLRRTIIDEVIVEDDKS